MAATMHGQNAATIQSMHGRHNVHFEVLFHGRKNFFAAAGGANVHPCLSTTKTYSNFRFLTGF